MRDAQESGLWMLSEQYLLYDEGTEARIHPRWLTTIDDAWLAELVAAICSFAGCTVEEADSRVFAELAERAGRRGISRRLIEALWLVERRRWPKRIDAPISPELLRQILFDRAAELGPRAAVGLVAEELHIGEELLRSSLFADRPAARRLVAPRELPSESLLRNRFNLALVEGFLVRASEIVATVPSHAHGVVLQARKRHLMTEVREHDDTLEIAISGPLALFHRTTKYGNALVRWLPALLAVECWSLACRVQIRGEERLLVIDDHAPLPRERGAGALDGKLALERELRRLGTGWQIDRESRIVRVGAHLFFADFTLVDTAGRHVAVEVQGFWTPDLLAARERLLEVAPEPILLCADRCNGEISPGPGILLFDGKIDMSALVSACAALLAWRQRRMPAPPSGPNWIVPVA